MIGDPIKNYRNVLNVLWFITKPKKHLLLLILITSFLCGFIEALNVALIYPIINYGVGADNNLFIFEYILTFVDSSTITPFVIFTILLGVVSCLNLVAQFIHVLFNSYAVAMINKFNDELVFNHFINEPYRFFIDNKQGELIYIGSKSTYEVGMVTGYLIEFLKNSIMIIFYGIFLCFLSLKGAVIVITLGVIYVFLNNRFIYKKVYRLSHIVTKEFQRKSVIYNELITGIKTIKIFNDFNFWRNKYHNSINIIFKNQIVRSVYHKSPPIFTTFLMFISISGIAMYIYHISSGDILPHLPLFGTFMFALYRLLPLVQGCLSDISYITQYLPNLELIYNLFNKYGIKATDEMKLESKLVNNIKSSKVSDFNFEKSISFENVSFSYNNRSKKILDNISFNIDKNKITAIVGASGAGKSTIVNLLTQLYEPSSGEIKIDELNIREINKNSFLRKIGYIGQETFIFNDTIKENIQFGLEDCTDEMILEAARLANAHDFIMETENGYETIIGDMGMKLSGGQRQRLAIARAILRKPELLILDEATSSLDTISEKNVMKAINNISKHTTTLIIAHRLSTIQNADNIIVLKNSKVVESGTHEQLIDRGREYYDLYQKTMEK